MRPADFRALTFYTEAKYASDAKRSNLPFWTAGGGKWGSFSVFDAFATVLTGELAAAGCVLADAARLVRDSCGQDRNGPRFLSEANFKKITSDEEDCYFGRAKLRAKGNWNPDILPDERTVFGTLDSIQKAVAAVAEADGLTLCNLVVANATDSWRQLAARAKLGGIDISNVFERQGE